MRLDELTRGLAGVAPAGATEAVEITGLAYDSRAVAPGSLFFCVSGFRSDGHDHAAEAVARGAAALVVERSLDLGVPEVAVASARAAMAPLAARFYRHPSEELRLVGVTGTNGKTTTAYLIRALLEAGGVRSGLLGTVKSVIGGEDREVQRTTPEAIDLQADLRAMLDAGDGACAMEVSSHALELGRADAVSFAAAVFTNLTQDHLDFHPTMEDYFTAKRRLFMPDHGDPPGVSVVNVADPWGRRLAEEVPGALTFGVEEPADYGARDLLCGFDGCRFTLSTPAGEREVTLPMPGRFNVANAVGALAVVHALGGDLDVLLGALEEGVRVPGRFEPVDAGQDFAVIVDYAHTPDSLENVLRAGGELVGEASGRVICVFGAGGDRDRGKRPLMGEIAARLADRVIVTSDNPRSEEPEAIIAEIMAGAGGEGAPGERPRGGAPDVSAITDRRAAIGEAIASGRTGDIIVIAGKGHEQGQEFADAHKLPFDDATVARGALEAVSAGTSGR
ncbi:MAG TPA: UDP-N-acetylmuramoyl-L-alanyl-D-glutamate--2,6-diaminopimelate ligase [Solirubrobacteraceae bacterium]|jgi:UDP-N-acetylmuramoyl-L-alanyl-D-glutamate--2,6-diaminopimelate ligase